MVQVLWQFLKVLNIHLAHDPSISLLGIYEREMKEYVHIKSYMQVFTAALFVFIITKT